MEVIADLSDLTLENLVAGRPDLIEAVRKLSTPPTAPPEAPPPIDLGAALKEAIGPLVERNEALSEAVAALQARLDAQDGTAAVNALMAEAGLSEAHADIVRADLTGRRFETPEALREAFDASVKRIDALLEANGTPRVSGLGGAPPEEQNQRPTAAEILREAGILSDKDGE